MYCGNMYSRHLFFSYGGFRVCLSTLIVELGLGLTPSISTKKPRGCTLIA